MIILLNVQFGMDNIILLFESALESTLNVHYVKKKKKNTSLYQRRYFRTPKLDLAFSVCQAPDRAAQELLGVSLNWNGSIPIQGAGGAALLMEGQGPRGSSHTCVVLSQKNRILRVCWVRLCCNMKVLIIQCFSWLFSLSFL